jgi:hypothetical protein
MVPRPGLLYAMVAGQALIFLEGSAMDVITRVAGTGTLGNSGDDGLATDAELRRPFGVAVTADGGFLIADTGNHEVRAVSAAGVMTRVAGPAGGPRLGQPGQRLDSGRPGQPGAADTRRAAHHLRQDADSHPHQRRPCRCPRRYLRDA